MIKLKDLIIEGWNSNIWPSDIWNSNLWNSDIWPSHVWEGQKQLNEIMGAKNFWMLPNGKIEDVGDHLDWYLDNVDSEWFKDDKGFPICSDGSIAEPEDVYDDAYKKGYVRLVKEPVADTPLGFEYNRSRPPTPNQMKNLKDFAIENEWTLFDDTIRRHVEL